MSDTTDFEYVDRAVSLQDLSKRLSGSDWFAIDTEFHREKTYYPQLCLIQVATPQIRAVIDPLALDDLAPLLELLFDPAKLKVLHAARQDLEIFFHLGGAVPGPVFDTQLAAPLLGYADQMGFGALVEAELGVKLAKGHARADWLRRPLPEAQLNYAIDDVHYLVELYQGVRPRLAQMGRLEWLNEDFRALEDPALYSVAPGEAWRRIKGAHRLRPAQLAVLVSLAEWREVRAREQNRPRNWILKDDVLLDIARARPTSGGALSQIRSLNPDAHRRLGKTLINIVLAAGNALPPEVSLYSPAPALTPKTQALVDVLSAFTKLIGERESIHHQALAPRKELELLAQGERHVNVLRGWRRRLVGEELLAVLAGEHGLRVKDGVLTIE
ncbi:MAG TPA: ribonuclease D [Gammaproteobacteria bacterium]|nr:ribonuclease D [Gammaproteobacteria bacterium]